MHIMGVIFSILSRLWELDLVVNRGSLSLDCELTS